MSIQRYAKDSVFRKLTEREINVLEAQCCTAVEWGNVEVGEGFLTESVRDCRFAGKVWIEAGAVIRNVRSRISNTYVASGARIEDVSVIETVGSTSFGVGTKVKTVNEAGGREVPIFPALSAQIAYIAAMFRNRPRVAARICEMVHDEYTVNYTNDIGYIGGDVSITGCRILRNTCLEGKVVLEGADILQNATVSAFTETPAYLGPGVKVYDSVISAGTITDGSVLKRCFVGGAKLSAATAGDSLFFSNCECENGEFQSIFAGPFTVSHHKSTLLIAAMFSFFNAGSGTNMSNHLFKSGAVHQGVFLRGAKCGSGSYVMLPSLIGPYMTVIGKHRSHPETDEFPFSVLIEENGHSYLLPGVNLGSSGTARDIVKWTQRDVRDPSSADIINLNENNPFITQKVLRAIEVSESLLEKDTVEIHSYKRVRIKATMLKRGLKFYYLGKDRFIGSMLARGEERVITGIDAADNTDGTGPWIDAAGMYVSKAAMDIILDRLEEDAPYTIGELQRTFAALYKNYKMYAFNWAKSVLEKDLGREASAEDCARAIQGARIAAPKLIKMIEDDERKETDASMAVSYGLDACDDISRMKDYRTVRRIK